MKTTESPKFLGKLSEELTPPMMEQCTAIRHFTTNIARESILDHKVGILNLGSAV